MKVHLLFMVLSFASILQAQRITVIDKTTREGIPGVIVYHPKSGASEISNSRGVATIPNLGDVDSLLFRLTGYKVLYLSKSNIESSNYTIEMQEASFELHEITVSANRWEENKTEIPQKVEIIGKKQIEFYNPQTSADLLELSGYAFIQKSQMAGGSPMLRGFATNRVLLVVDGVRMNNAIFRSGNLQNVISIDANSLENSEVLFGPGAVMYGSDAIGGVMDFHTLKTRFSDTSGKLLVKTNAFARYSSANSEKTGHLDVNLAGKKWSSLSSISYSDYSDLRCGSVGNPYFLRPNFVKTENGKDSTYLNTDPNLQVGSGFDQLNLIQKLHFRPNASIDVEYGFYYSVSSDAGRYDRLTLDENEDGVLDFAQWYYGPQKWMMNRLTVTHQAKSKLADKVKLTAALQNFEESRHDRRFNNVNLRHQTERVNAYSFNFDLDKQVNKKLTLFYGAEAVYNKIGSRAVRQNIHTSLETPSQTRYPDGSDWQAAGLYANSKYKHSEKWIFSAGIRYSHYSIRADFDTTFLPFPFTKAQNQSGALNGSAGFVFSPGSGWQIYSNLSTGFRAPNLDDMGKVFESEPGSVVVPNQNLKPEYAYNAEIGTVKSFGNYLKVDLAAYYTFLNNAIARRDYTYNGQDSILYDGEMSKVLAMQNIAQAMVYGIQGGFDLYFMNGFRLKSTISYQKGQEQEANSLTYYPKPHVAPLFGATHLIYSRKQLKLDFFSQYNAAMSYNDLPLVDRTDNSIYAKTPDGLPYVPAWYTLNIKISWFLNQHVSFNAGLDNLTNQLYRTYSSGISAPGRNITASVRYKF